MNKSFNPLPDLTRRQWLVLAVAAAVMAILAALSVHRHNGPLRIAGQSAWPGYALSFLAEKQGLLPKDDVTLINTNNLDESSAMLASGKVDGAMITLDQVLALRHLGIPVSVVAILDVSAGGDAVLAKPTIKQPSDLRGKTIGVEQSSLGTIMLAKLLEAAALNKENVRVKRIGLDHLQSMKENDFDAIITYEPNPTLFESQGMNKIFDSRQLPNLIVDVLAVRTDKLSRQNTALRKLVNGHFQMLKHWNTNPIDTGYKLVPILGIQANEVKKTFYGLNLPDISYNMHYLAAPAIELNKSAQAIVDILEREHQPKHAVNLDQLFIADFLPQERE